MPNDLISRDALIEDYCHNKQMCRASYGHGCSGGDCISDMDIVLAQPVVDAVPAVHARWIICSDGYYPYCSECKEEPKSGIMTHYCPNCGCKMVLDGKDDNE